MSILKHKNGCFIFSSYELLLALVSKRDDKFAKQQRGWICEMDIFLFWQFCRKTNFCSIIRYLCERCLPWRKKFWSKASNWFWFVYKNHSWRLWNVRANFKYQIWTLQNITRAFVFGWYSARYRLKYCSCLTRGIIFCIIFIPPTLEIHLCHSSFPYCGHQLMWSNINNYSGTHTGCLLQ